MIVGEAMSMHTYTAAPDETALSAAHTLTQLEITGLPVVDAERKVLGMITLIDLIRAIRRGDQLGEVPVSALMQVYPIFVTPETGLLEAAGLMEEWGVHRLPVCREGRLAGVLSRGDVLRCLLGGPVAV